MHPKKSDKNPITKCHEVFANWIAASGLLRVVQGRATQMSKHATYVDAVGR